MGIISVGEEHYNGSVPFQSRRVIEAYELAYPEPIRVSEGDEVTIEERAAEWGWRLFFDTNGRAGWIPETYVETETRRGLVPKSTSQENLQWWLGTCSPPTLRSPAGNGVRCQPGTLGVRSADLRSADLRLEPTPRRLPLLHSCLLPDSRRGTHRAVRPMGPTVCYLGA